MPNPTPSVTGLAAIIPAPSKLMKHPYKPSVVPATPIQALTVPPIEKLETDGCGFTDETKESGFLTPDLIKIYSLPASNAA